MENNLEILLLKPISKCLYYLDLILYSLDPHANVRAQAMIEIRKGEAQKIPETNGATNKKRRGN